jgi:hypothetical protein
MSSITLKVTLVPPTTLFGETPTAVTAMTAGASSADNPEYLTPNGMRHNGESRNLAKRIVSRVASET